MMSDISSNLYHRRWKGNCAPISDAPNLQHLVHNVTVAATECNPMQAYSGCEAVIKCCCMEAPLYGEHTSSRSLAQRRHDERENDEINRLNKLVNFTGYQYGNALNLRWPFWCTRHWMAFHHSTWRMTVNSSQPLAAGDFDRLMLLPATFHEPAQLWAIDPSPLLVHICGTIYRFIFVTLNYRFPSFAGYWKRICLAEDRGA